MDERRFEMALLMAFAAVAVGFAFALTRYLESLLFGVPQVDPWTYGAAAAVLLAVSLAAAAIPARRGARRSDKALRYE